MNDRVRVDVHPTLTADLKATLHNQLASVQRRITAQARTDAPVDTGRLAASIAEDNISWTGPFIIEGGVTAHAPYSRFVHEGTRAHVIKPRNATVLVFDVGGETVFARHVNHPGTKAQPFLTAAAKHILGSGAVNPGRK